MISWPEVHHELQFWRIRSRVNSHLRITREIMGTWLPSESPGKRNPNNLKIWIQLRLNIWCHASNQYVYPYTVLYVTVPAPKSGKRHLSWAHFCLSFAAAWPLPVLILSLTHRCLCLLRLLQRSGVRKSVLYDTFEIIHPGQSSYLAAWFSSHGSGKWAAGFHGIFPFQLSHFPLKNHQLLLGKLWKSWISIKPTSPTWWRDAYN